jgi:signal transduction histidine kinase
VRSASNLTKKPFRVLLIEDNETDADLIVHTMLQANLSTRVDLAATRKQFTELLAGHEYDLVLAAYRLPDWTGMDALRELRRLGIDIPFIIVTGALDDARAVECVKAGAADYVLKGNNLARLTIAANRAIEEKRARDELIRAHQLMGAERFQLLTDASFDEVRQAQKMEAVGRLAGGVAHDFNNLLTVILSYADMLIEGVSPKDPRAQDLGEIRKAAVAAASLTRQLLAFSRQQVIEPRVLILEDVVDQTQKLLKRLIGEDIDLAMQFGPAPSVVHIDPGQLEQVLMNLAVNARDAMPTGGKLTIETAVVELDENYAAAHWPATTGRFAMLAVSDTGIGMDEATRARIFEPFFTTKGPGKGTGLGLATVYGIVKQSGGFIWTYSEPGKGATFKIYLPLHDGAPTAANEEREKPPAVDGSETVLLVEDSDDVRYVARKTLEQHGYEVMDAPSASAALSLAAQLDRPVHLLLTDVVMPEMSGRVLAEKFAMFQPHAKVLYMSGYTDDAIIRHGVLRAKIPFLQKPFTPLALATRVREVLDT